MGRIGLADKDAATLRGFVGPPLLESFRRTWSLDAAAGRAAVDAYREHYAARGLYETVLYPGIDRLLRALCGRGQPLMVATSKPTVFAERVLEHFLLRACFRAVVGSHLDDTRTDKAEVVAAALSLLDADAARSAALVGDREQDIRAARTHGLRAVAVAYGYAAPGELEAAAPDVLVRTVEELRACLELRQE